MSLGRRISSMRGFHNLTQEELGKKIHVSKQTVCNWEADYRSPDASKIRLLCKALDCTADYLLELTDQPSEHVNW